MDYSNSPDYLKAADLHNVGAGTTSFFSDPGAAVVDAAESTVDFVAKVPAFAISSIASGVNSIYNSGVVAGNFFGLTDAKENDTQEMLGALDSDLGKYYGEHKQAADLAGFVATSFVPGMAGVKLVNGGQRLLTGALRSGAVAEGLAEATGLATTMTTAGKTLTQLAGEGLATGGQTFTVMNAGVLKALAGGVGQAAVESFAFEAMVQATMFKSPVLEDQDIRGIGSNLLTATVLGGAIGGMINAASVYGGVKKILTATDLKNNPHIAIAATDGLEASDRIIMRAQGIANSPLATDDQQIKLAQQRAVKVEQLDRMDIHAISDDATLGNTVADMVGMLAADQKANVMSGAKQISRPGFMFTPAEGNSVGYVKLHGVDGVGDVSFDGVKNSTLNLADKLVPVGKQTMKEAIDSKVAIAEASWKGKKAGTWNMTTAGSMDEIEARYIWAEQKATYTDGMTIHPSDIPLQEGALKRGLNNIVIDDGVHQYSVSTLDDLRNEVIRNKQAMADSLGQAGKAAWGLNGAADGAITAADIAKATNVSLRSLESEVGDGVTGASMFARQDAQKAYDKIRTDAGLPIGEVSDLTYIPQHVAIVYDAARAAHVNSDLVSAMVNVRMEQKLARESGGRAFANFSGSLDERFPAITDAEMQTANRSGAGAGIVSSANGGPGTLASKMEYIGKSTSDLIQQTQKRTRDVIESIALRLRSDQAGAIEFSKLNDLRNSTTEKYILNEAGDGLIAKSVQEYRDAVKAGKPKTSLLIPQLQEGTPAEIKFINKNAGEAITADIEANGYRISHENQLRNAEGSTSMKDPNSFYGWKPDPRSMKFFAFVKDETLSGQAAGHTSMIHANTETQLADMMELARGKGFKVYTKDDTQNFYKAQQSYEFDRTLHENSIDSSLKSAGINNSFFPKTDAGNIVDEWMASHARRDSAIARDAVAVKYAGEFDQLDTLGQQYTGTASSQYGVTTKSIENTVKNPYNDYRKTALDISRLGEYPLLSSVNRGLENIVSGTVQKISDAWNASKGIDDLPAINKMLADAGINHSYGTAAEMILANHIAAKPYLSNFIRGANSILANTFLRMDFLNPLTNALGAQVLLGMETSVQGKAALRALDKAGITVPGTTDAILSPLKLIAKANADWLAKTPELDALFKSEGLTTTLRQQMHSMLDDVSTAGELANQAAANTMLAKVMAKSKAITDFGSKVTGNDLAEEYNRWVAAHVAKQIHDTQVAAGLAQSDGLGAFMNTFVNRTQTNTLASQRPLLFQGPVGQAIGLFQSFQFNTMQQLFRGISEGSGKDAAMAMGLQGTLFGLNGLPAFQYINQHIVGTASGNTQHTDAYSALYGSAGKTAGDWLMYGIPSNLLQTNIYSRGDINPRSLTIVPVAPQDIVAVSAFTKFAGNLKDTFGKMAGGGDVWQSVLQGLEHNGISRPLAGLAQTLQATGPAGKVYSTSGNGDISFVNDFMSLATLSRLAGGKPLDEALANDQIQRSMAYQAADKERMKAATAAFKSTVIGDQTGTATPDAVHDYMKAFVKNGGRQEQFNQNMLHTMTQVNTPKANQVIQALKGTRSEQMKVLMGGGVQGLGDLTPPNQ